MVVLISYLKKKRKRRKKGWNGVKKLELIGSCYRTLARDEWRELTLLGLMKICDCMDEDL